MCQAIGTSVCGDFALSATPSGAVVERKTPTQIANCLGRDRECFEQKLERGRYVSRIVAEYARQVEVLATTQL